MRSLLPPENTVKPMVTKESYPKVLHNSQDNPMAEKTVYGYIMDSKERKRLTIVHLCYTTTVNLIGIAWQANTRNEW